MVEVVRIPKLGLSDRGDLVTWEVETGDRVEAGEVVAILESEKASAEIEAPAAGVFLGSYVEEGEEIDIEVGKPLAVIGESGESIPSLEEVAAGDVSTSPDTDDSATDVRPEQESESDSSSGSSVKVTPRAKRLASEENVDLSEIEGTGPQGAVSEDDVRAALEAGSETDSESKRRDVKATPRAKRLASEEDVDLSNIDGTGPQGAVSEEDVEEYLSSEASSGDRSDSGDLTIKESNRLTGTRKTIANRLSQSAREKPHVMGTREISIERLKSLQSRLERRYGVEVSLNDLILFFVGRVLSDLPEFNAHYEDGVHKLIEEINVGYAVDGPRGLVVPVLDEVTELSVTELAETRRDAVSRALDGEYTAEDLQGGTFTVTNVGVFDMDISYSIINPPEVAILAVGRRKQAPVERDGEITFDTVVTMSLTIDHRVLDGADSGAFLEQVAEYMEYPSAALESVREAES